MNFFRKTLYLVCFQFLFLNVSGKDGVDHLRLIDYVKTDIGTAHCRWFHYTPGAVPFGMAKLAPSTNGHYGNPGGWEAVGYDCRHASIEGFPCFHEFQVGGVVIAPLTGQLQTIPGRLENPEEGYRSRFDKKDEYAIPGYYSVLLKDYQVKAELTATERVGFQRYTFPQSQESHIVFDIGNKQGESGEVKDAVITFDGKDRIEGFVTTYPVYVNKYQKGADVTMYFAAVVDQKPAAWGTFTGADVNKGNSTEKGKGAGLYLSYKTKQGEAVTIRFGLSYTSVDNARLNLEKEASTLTFDQAKAHALQKWENALGRIVVEGKNDEDKVKFYTGLYHALLGRGLASDVNGAYPKNDGTIGQIKLKPDGKPVHNHYNTDAIWGAFWNLTQLWTLAYPDYFSDWVQSQLLVYRDAGWLGDGIACSRFVSGVGTNYTGLAIAAAYNCGIRDFDAGLAYEAARKNELEWKDRIEGAGKMDTKQFVTRGFCPYIENATNSTDERGSRFSASHTLEYSFSASAVAQFAKLLGKTSDYQELTKLSGSWKTLFDPETGLIRPKDDSGTFLEQFNPLQPWRGFQEGNAVQYTFYVPHDIGNLIGLVGKEAFNNRLDSIFIISRNNLFGGGTTIDAFAGVNTLYNHGNQPNLQASWLFNFSGRPDLTQKWVRTICNEFYGSGEVHGYGYGQDEDQGQLGAWYVMSAIGLFDLKGLTGEVPEFQIGSPLFDRISIRLHPEYYSGKEFVIEAQHNSNTHLYIKGKQLNGTICDGISIPFSEIVKGGRLILEMSDVSSDLF